MLKIFSCLKVVACMMGIQGIERNGSGENPVSNRNHRQHVACFLFQQLLLAAKLLTISCFRLFLGAKGAEEYPEMTANQ